MKTRLFLTFFLFLLLIPFSYATLNHPQRQGDGTVNQIFTQSEFDDDDYDSYDDLSTKGSAILPVCSDDVFRIDNLAQEGALCMGYDSGDTIRAYVLDYDTHELSVLSGTQENMSDFAISDGQNTYCDDAGDWGGVQAQAFLDVDGDGFDEWNILVHEVSGADLELHTYEPDTTNNPTAWTLADSVIVFSTPDQRDVGAELACNMNENNTPFCCVVGTSGIKCYAYDTGTWLARNTDGVASGIANYQTNPVYLTLLDLDDDGDLEAIFLEKEGSKYDVRFMEAKSGGNEGKLIDDIFDQTDYAVSIGTDSRAFMYTSDWSNDAGTEIFFSAVEKTGSIYRFHWLAFSSSGSLLQHYNETFDSSLRITQPYTCLHNSENICVKLYTASGVQIYAFDDSYAGTYPPALSPVEVTQSTPYDSECWITEHVPYMNVIESEQDSDYNDDFYTVYNGAICTAYNGVQLVGGCSVSGKTFVSLADFDNDGYRDVLYTMNDESCLVLSGAGLGINYQPDATEFSYDTATPACENETVEITADFCDPESDEVQFRYRCNANYNYSVWIDLDDTFQGGSSTMSCGDLNFSCEIDKTNITWYNVTEETICEVWGSTFIGNLADWAGIIDCEGNTQHYFWATTPDIEIRDDAVHIIYNNPNTESGYYTWTNGSICYDEGEGGVAGSAVCGNFVCEIGENSLNCPTDCEEDDAVLPTGIETNNSISNLTNVLDDYTGLGSTVIWLLIMLFVSVMVFTQSPASSGITVGIIAFLNGGMLIIGAYMGLIGTGALISVLVIAIALIGFQARRLFTGAG